MTLEKGVEAEVAAADWVEECVAEAPDHCPHLRIIVTSAQLYERWE
jgi:hypothetical protein